MDKQKTKEERYSELLKLVQEIPFPSTDAIAKKYFKQFYSIKRYNYRRTI
ncbi:hypothetical protein ONA24_04565 [Mycoplasmopsis cynos]|nr:hypothetical protein [Mycoplasmopsis cynos]UWV93485.1 hypothetical protein NW062_06075 [Mycoplasmopsis cynos]WAM09324.1 hypothetical protein ONA24_04565 [Mycoplasmopsis cynos]